MTGILLSPRQNACIQWICHGKSIAFIAALQGKTVQDIELTLEQARLALGTDSLSQTAIRAGLIKPACDKMRTTATFSNEPD